MKATTQIKIIQFGMAMTLLLVATASALAQSGTWTNLINGDASGTWSVAANWNNGVIADGADNMADFSTLDITTNSTVTLDTDRTIGNLIFGDIVPDANWILTGGTLTLQTSSGVPTLTANNGTNIIASTLAGTMGFTKSGDGTINLSDANNNTLSGNININAGILEVGNNNALGVGIVNGGAISNTVTIADGATLEVLGGIQPNLKPAFVSGDGVGGTQGAIYADLSGQGQGTANTRWSIGLHPTPAVVMLTNTTIRVDGTNNTALAASMLIGQISTSNALTSIPANYTNFTLTKTGTGQLRIDPANGYTGGNIHLAQGSLAFGNNGDLPAYQTLTIDAGTFFYCRNVSSLNSANSSLVVNGMMDLDARGNGNPASDTTTANQTIGYLSGSGIVTNGSAGNNGVNTLTIGGTNGSSTTFSGVIPQCAVGSGSIGLRLQNTNSTLVLSGNNTYAGTTILNAGTLLVDGTHIGGGAYTVNPAATLGGSGTISSVSDITLNGGTLMAGDLSSPGGTLTLSNNVAAASPGAIIISNATLAAYGSLGASGQPVGNVSMNNGTLQIPVSSAGASVFASAFNVDGNSTISYSMATPVKGQFPIISYSSLGGLVGFSGLSLVSPAGITATLSNNVANSTIDVVISDVPVIVWDGTHNGDWDIGITPNWQGNTYYTEPGGVGLIAVFDDTASGTTSINLTTTLTPKGVLANNNSLSYTFSGSGHITGTGGIVKEGSGTLTVANSGNDFTGGATIQQGTLQVGNSGTTGDLGAGPIVNSGTLALDRSDSFTLANTVSGNGNITQSGAGAVTVPFSGDSSGAVVVNDGLLQLAPTGSNQLSGSVSGAGAFGVNGAGTTVLSGSTINYTGGTVISNGTLQFNSIFPPAGDITDDGVLALGTSGEIDNNISGSGGISIVNGADVTLGSGKTYTGPTTVLNSTLEATASTYPSGSPLVLGNQVGGAETGVANFSAGNPVLGGLMVGGNVNAIANTVNLTAGNQTLTINGNMSFGNVGPSGAQIGFQFTGSGASVVVNTNGGVIQLGLYSNPNGGNPDSVYVDFSQIDNFTANLGTNGSVNLGTLDGNPGPTTEVNDFLLASVSNSITAGVITIGAGGRQLVPELLLGAGTNVLNVNMLNLGTGGRDGGYLHFAGGSGGVQLRASDGISRAAMNVGVDAATGTGASITNTVDLTGHPADLLLSALIIGDYNNTGIYQNTFSFDTGVLDTLSTSLSLIRNTSTATAITNAALSSSTLNINGGVARLGAVSLTGSVTAGTLNVNNADVTVSNITYTSSGAATLSLNNATLNIDMPGFGNPVAAPVAASAFSASGTVNLGLNGTGFTVGQFPLISYTGSIGGDGFSALNLASLPTDVSGYLSNDTANASVDLVITAAPPAINPNPTNILINVSGNQLTLSWPSDHIGWLLQSNSVGLINTDAWFTVSGSAGTNHLNLTVDAAKTNVFYRLLKP
ncbi:MAG: beta strand repeat-containing protein [Limisphaerales bacterium]